MRCFLFRLRYYSNDQWNIRAHVNAAGEICGHDISHIGILSSHNLKSVTDLINRAKQSVNSDFFASGILSVLQVCGETSCMFSDSHPEHVNTG